MEGLSAGLSGDLPTPRDAVCSPTKERHPPARCSSESPTGRRRAAHPQGAESSARGTHPDSLGPSGIGRDSHLGKVRRL